MAHRTMIGVVGTGANDPKMEKLAEELGARIAQAGWVVVSGGRDAGVMRAVNKGAKARGGLTVGILPRRQSKLSDDIDVPIITDMNNARNNIIGLSCDVLVACGVESPGTASEV